MLHYQRFHEKHPDKSISEKYKRTWYHATLCGAAIAARVEDHCIHQCMLDLDLVVLTYTYTNVMETLYCTTAYLSLGNHGWMRLWSFDLMIFKDVKIQEVQCLAVGAFIAYFAYVLIFALNYEGRRRWYRWVYTVALSVGFFYFRGAVVYTWCG